MGLHGELLGLQHLGRSWFRPSMKFGEPRGKQRPPGQTKRIFRPTRCLSDCIATICDLLLRLRPSIRLVLREPSENCGITPCKSIQALQLKLSDPETWGTGGLKGNRELFMFLQYMHTCGTYQHSFLSQSSMWKRNLTGIVMFSLFSEPSLRSTPTMDTRANLKGVMLLLWRLEESQN